MTARNSEGMSLGAAAAGWPYHTETRFRPLRFASAAAWRSYADWLRLHVRVSLALAPEPQRKPLRARIFGRREGNGYAREKVAFESPPGFFVTGNLHRPLARGAKRHPVVLVAQGHSYNQQLREGVYGFFRRRPFRP